MPTVSKNTNMESKIDKLTTMVEALSKDMSDVKRVLKGDDEYGAKGLVESHKKLKKDCLEVKEDIKKAKIAGTVMAAVLGFFGSILALFKN
jgi:hypothetical protein